MNMDHSNDKLVSVVYYPYEGDVWYEFLVPGHDSGEPVSTSTTRWPGVPPPAQGDPFHGTASPLGGGPRSRAPHSGTAGAGAARRVDLHRPSPHNVGFESAPADVHDTSRRTSLPRPRARQQPRFRADLWEEHILDPDITQRTASEAAGGSAAAVGRLRDEVRNLRDEMRDMRDEVRIFSDERENLSNEIRHLYGRLDRLDRSYRALHGARAPDIAATEPHVKGKEHAPTAAGSSSGSETVDELLKKVTTKMRSIKPPPGGDWTDVLQVLNDYTKAHENAVDHERPATQDRPHVQKERAVMVQHLSLHPESSQAKV